MKFASKPHIISKFAREMSGHNFLRLCVLLGAMSLVDCQQPGVATVNNWCSFPVYLKSDLDYNPPLQTLETNHTYQEIYRTNDQGAGVSIKMTSNRSIANAPNTSIAFDQSTITQFEYTYHPGVGLWYDISNVNGGDPWPFELWGLALNTSDPQCMSVPCPPNKPCTAGYIKPHDDHAVHQCGTDQSLSVTLCYYQGYAPKWPAALLGYNQTKGQSSCTCA